MKNTENYCRCNCGTVIKIEIIHGNGSPQTGLPAPCDQAEIDEPEACHEICDADGERQIQEPDGDTQVKVPMPGYTLGTICATGTATRISGVYPTNAFAKCFQTRAEFSLLLSPPSDADYTTVNAASGAWHFDAVPNARCKALGRTNYCVVWYLYPPMGTTNPWTREDKIFKGFCSNENECGT